MPKRSPRAPRPGFCGCVVLIFLAELGNGGVEMRSGEEEGSRVWGGWVVGWVAVGVAVAVAVAVGVAVAVAVAVGVVVVVASAQRAQAGCL